MSDQNTPLKSGIRDSLRRGNVYEFLEQEMKNGSTLSIVSAKIYGTWDAFLVEQLKEHEDVSGYLSAIMEEYQTYGNIATIQIALQSVVEAQGGISEFAKKTDLEPQVLLKVLDSTKAPRIETLRTVLSALGCRLSIVSLETVNPPIAVVPDGSTASIEAVDPNHNLD